MDCKEFKNIVADLFNKVVDPQTKAECEEHISQCAECREYYEEMLTTAELLRPKYSPVIESEKVKVKSGKTATVSILHKVAALFAGMILLSGIAFAAIHILHQNQKSTTSQPEQTGNVTKPVSIVPDDTITTDTLYVESRVFDNVPLDTMLNEMASFYQTAVEFQREESRQLRLHFKWKRSESLDRVVERLNNFEAVTIIREPEKLIVK